MTIDGELNTPWNLHFDRDGTEDFGIISDKTGIDLVASHLPSTPRGDRAFQQGTFWLPEYEGDPVPLLVRQMKLMAAAPQLLAMLKIAIATADPAKQQWVEEAREVIEDATGLMYRQQEAKPYWHLHRAAPRLCAALETCHAMLEDYIALARFVDARLKPKDRAGTDEIEQARREAFAALCEARGEIAF